MNRPSLFRTLAFAAGLAAIGWAGAGYLASNPLALMVILVIAAFYLLGAWELRGYQQATDSLRDTLADEAGLPQPATGLGPWLDRLHPSLRNAVRLRIEGERTGLPGPALAPYLTGLLVLLGMLGTFLGMVVTLQGTGSALQSASDLQAVRSTLAAPVQGLGLAFGTSLAGIAGSAMLGLLSALCRRERLQAAQQLDARIGTGLRVFSLAHQREESFKLLQRQSEVMPALVDRLQAMMATLEQQNRAMNERLLAGQDAFHHKAATAYSDLAASVGQSLNESLRESARAAGAVIEPVVHSTMAGIASTFEQGSESLVRTVSTQLASAVGDVSSQLGDTLGRVNTKLESTLDGVSTRLETTLGGVSSTLEGTLTRVSGKLDSTLDAVSTKLDTTLDGVSSKLDMTLGAVGTRLDATLGGVSTKLDATLDGVSSKLDTTVDGISAKLETTVETVSSRLEANAEGIGTQLASTLQGVSANLASTLEQVSTHLQSSVEQVNGSWSGALALHQQTNEALSASTQDALRTAAASFESHSAALLRTMDESHVRQQDALASRDEARLSAWTESLQGLASGLDQHWQDAGAKNLAQQERICETLSQTADRMAAQSQEHARATIGEIAQLVQAASEAPRAAAEVMAQLRQKLSDSMERDNTLLEERAAILQTLETLLGAINHAATEQRTAIDALVTNSSELLQRVGKDFGEQVQAQTGQFGTVAAQLTGSAVEVASLGEAFGAAVQLFGDANEKMVAQLQRIEGALGKAMARSDEQLDYYVAQAREVVDLSIRSQKQILEDLQQIGAGGHGRGPLATGEA